uniref:Uncharacterized protein n=1 Tax=Glossina brevipalpis TaxID=37001 RepID=A0A1A9X405_9MUSC
MQKIDATFFICTNPIVIERKTSKNVWKAYTARHTEIAYAHKNSFFINQGAASITMTSPRPARNSSFTNTFCWCSWSDVSNLSKNMDWHEHRDIQRRMVDPNLLCPPDNRY